MRTSLKVLTSCVVMSIVALGLMERLSGASADPPGCPALSFPSNYCGKGGDTCNITISLENGKVILSPADAYGDTYVKKGSTIKWTVSGSEADHFAVHFPHKASPFGPGTNHFTAAAGENAGARAARGCKSKNSLCCYPYTVVWFGQDGTARVSDPRITNTIPRIIIDGGGGIPERPTGDAKKQ